MTAAELTQKVADRYERTLNREADSKKREEIKRLKYKIFYSAPSTWEKPNGRILMGMYPGGPGIYEFPAEKLDRAPEDGWNAYENEKWEPVKVVENLTSLFRGWYGSNWHQELSQTFCSNICPYRANSEAGMLDFYPTVIEDMMPLWQEFLQGLKPRLILCHGNKEGLSSYMLLSRLYPPDGNKTESATAIGTLKVRWHVHSAPWGKVGLVGLPFLGKGKTTVLLQNNELADFIRKQDTPKRTEVRVLRKAAT